MRVLITGANGFIGKALCERMHSDGWHVRRALRNIECDIATAEGIESIQINSIDQDTDWQDALKGIDTVVHLAARVHVMKDSSRDPLAAFRRVNVDGTRHLARAASSARVKRFVYISSIKVNGEESDREYSESSMSNPQDPYAVSKWEAEQALHHVSDETGLNAVILRPPLVYGSGVRANFLSLMKIVDRGIPLPFAGIKNLRSQIFLNNFIDAILICSTHPGAVGQTYMVSDDDDVSTAELIRRIGFSLDVKARLFNFPAFLLQFAGVLTGNSQSVKRVLKSLTVDITKIKKELEWKAPYTMEQGLKETAQWYRKAFSNNKG